MDWSASIDAYCERTSEAFWAEPLNAVSNVAFLVAAVAAARLVSRRAPGDGAGWFLSVLIGGIGIGSFLFHTYATRWAALADVLPIAVFIHGYLYFAMRRFLWLPVWASVAVVVAFFAGSTGVERLVPDGALNGSFGYMPALLAMLVVGLLLLGLGRPGGTALLQAAAVFLVSLTARTFDEAVCGLVPIGIHYVWHMLNAVVLYLLTRALIVHGRRHA
ncbi:ceramidase domain-containing protein [Lutibaculum baratangense]|uniref:Membrane protein n=1 Tax=Lutibaculum baratangense AMV1 TaxID=631454 RepID=V4RJU6_9HYPH|nr:ceramidase domain-containing protein [Lutibaculum baratangense]ESR23520.1 membrane protein [Lutibaculum baratangense AMV1]